MEMTDCFISANLNTLTARFTGYGRVLVQYHYSVSLNPNKP